MRTRLLIISFILFLFLPRVYSQSYYPQNFQPQAKSGCHINGSRLPKQPTGGIEDLSYFFLNNYQSDSTAYGLNFKGSQTELINSAYNYYSADTSNIFNVKNYYCINAISVAFDSIPGYSNDTIVQTQINTIYVPVIQVNHSGLNDTLELQLTTVDINGYPLTNTYLADTLIIDSTNHFNNIGAGNDYTVNTIKWYVGDYALSGGRFAVNVTYHDSTKKDSCWFIYGYGSFPVTCPYESNTNTFAAITKFSKLNATPKDFYANSFSLFNEYAGQGSAGSYGYLPTSQGNNIFFPCTAADTDHYTPNVDGANYIQDIDIAASVLFVSFTGIHNLHSPGISVNQNYPNPYNNSTVINYSLINPGEVSLKITDLTGRELLSENYGMMSPGQHAITLGANSFSAGVYFYSITGSGYTVTKKMVIY